MLEAVTSSVRRIFISTHHSRQQQEPTRLLRTDRSGRVQAHTHSIGPQAETLTMASGTDDAVDEPSGAVHDFLPASRTTPNCRYCCDFFEPQSDFVTWTVSENERREMMRSARRTRSVFYLGAYSISCPWAPSPLAIGTRLWTKQRPRATRTDARLLSDSSRGSIVQPHPSFFTRVLLSTRVQQLYTVRCMICHLVISPYDERGKKQNKNVAYCAQIENKEAEKMKK